MFKLQTRWHRFTDFVSKERFLVGASVFRIVAGLIILYVYLINYQQRHYLFGPHGIWPYEYMLESVFINRSFSLYAIDPSLIFFETLFHLSLLVTVLWIVGWRTRLMTLLTFICLWSIHERNPLLLDGGNNVFIIVLLYACFANLGAYFSLDATQDRTTHHQNGMWRRMSAMFHNTSILAFAIQLCLVYGVAGLYKVQGEMWQSGTAIYYVMRIGNFAWPGYSEHIYQNAFLVTFFTYATVAFQLSFPFLLFLNRYTRWFALLAALMFHVGIGAFMGLVTFSAFILSIELALITDDEYRGVWQRLRSLYTYRMKWCFARWNTIRRRLAPANIKR